jgi:hypothetical protein
VAKHTHKNRSGTRVAPPPRWAAAQPEDGGLNPRVKLGVIAGVATLLIVGLAVAAIAFAAGFATVGSDNLPAGTQVFAENDHTHVGGTVTYDHVPPAGGAHNPVQLNCGIYSQAVPNENAVHSLEHGAVWITYQPNLDVSTVGTLQQIVLANYVGTQRYLILSPYAGLPSPIVASAWGAQLRVDQATDPRLVQFIRHFAGGGQGRESGGPCTGGVGTPAA